MKDSLTLNGVTYDLIKADGHFFTVDGTTNLPLNLIKEEAIEGSDIPRRIYPSIVIGNDYYGIIYSTKPTEY